MVPERPCSSSNSPEKVWCRQQTIICIMVFGNYEKLIWFENVSQSGVNVITDKCFKELQIDLI